MMLGAIVFVLGLAGVVALWLPTWAALLVTGACIAAIGGLLSWVAIPRSPKAQADALTSETGA